MGGALLDRLPGLLLEAAVDGLGDGRLHQVDVADDEGHEQILQVFVKGPVAQVSCGRGKGAGPREGKMSGINSYNRHFNLFLLCQLESIIRISDNYL